MSSILKALKKLEQETAENAGTPLTSDITGRPKRQAKRRAGSLVIPGLIAFTLCIFTGVGIAIFTQYTPTSESNGPASITPNSTAGLKNDGKQVTSEIIPAGKISIPKKAAEIDNQKQPRTGEAAPEFAFTTVGTSIAEKQLVDVKKEVQKFPPEMLPEVEMTTKLPGYDYATATGKTADSFSHIMPEPGTVNEKRLPIEEDPEPAAAFQAEVATDEAFVPDLPDARKHAYTDMPVVKKTEPPVAVIKDPSIELQAISWSTDPDKRLAIINGKICREKDHVGGYMIQAIKSDEVILTKGSVKGKLVFEIR